MLKPLWSRRISICLLQISSACLVNLWSDHSFRWAWTSWMFNLICHDNSCNWTRLFIQGSNLISVVIFKHMFKCLTKPEFMSVPVLGSAEVAPLRGSDFWPLWMGKDAGIWLLGLLGWLAHVNHLGGCLFKTICWVNLCNYLKQLLRSVF